MMAKKPKWDTNPQLRSWEQKHLTRDQILFNEKKHRDDQILEEFKVKDKAAKEAAKKHKELQEPVTRDSVSGTNPTPATPAVVFRCPPPVPLTSNCWHKRTGLLSRACRDTPQLGPS